MKEEKNRLETAFGETPDMFHQRVEQTLSTLQAEKPEKHAMKRKVNWGLALLAALLLVSAVGVAVKFAGVLDFLTNTAAKNWVLDDAKSMVHIGGESVSIGTCTAGVKEWVCDGRRLFATISVIDPALQTEGYYVPENEDEDYLAGLERYGLAHDLMEAFSDQGTVQVRSADYRWGDEQKCEILYTYEIELEAMPNAYTIMIPVSCSEGENTLTIDVTSADYGRMQNFEPSEIFAFEGYTAQITQLQASSLRTYGELKLTFDASIDEQLRENIAGDYMEGLLAPEGRLDIIAGEGEEIAYPTGAVWTEDGWVCTISLEGNPREAYPERIAFYPRKGASIFDREGEWPSLNENGAIQMKL